VRRWLGAGGAAGRRAGVSLVEVLICIALLAAALVPFVGTLGDQAKGSEILRGRAMAESHAESTIRSLRSMPWTSLQKLEANPDDEATRSEQGLPPPPDALRLEQLVFEDVAGMDPSSARKVTLRYAWQVAGRWPAPDAPDRARVTLERKAVVANRVQSLQADGVVH